MTTSELKSRVRLQFNMELAEFLKQKVEVEHLYDYEIARILKADAALVGRLRKAFGIKRAEGFQRRFEQTYGAGAIEKFKQIIEKPENTLADLGRYFGFSREYARQVYRNIYGYPYTEAFRKKILARKHKLHDERMKRKRIAALMSVRKKIESLGLPAYLRTRRHGHEIFVNGHKVALRCTSKTMMIGNNRYFRISNRLCANQDCDFFICLCRSDTKNAHYIIPRHAMPKYGVYLPPDAGPHESKYAAFKEAWHLLTDRKQTQGVS